MIALAYGCSFHRPYSMTAVRHRLLVDVVTSNTQKRPILSISLKENGEGSGVSGQQTLARFYSVVASSSVISDISYTCSFIRDRCCHCLSRSCSSRQTPSKRFKHVKLRNLASLVITHACSCVTTTLTNHNLTQRLCHHKLFLNNLSASTMTLRLQVLLHVVDVCGLVQLHRRISIVSLQFDLQFDLVRNYQHQLYTLLQQQSLLLIQQLCNPTVAFRVQLK